MPGIKQTMSNKRTYLPRKAKQKVTEAAAAATRVLTGVEEQPGKMIMDIYIDFEKFKPCDQIMQKVKPNFNAPFEKRGVKIGAVPALVDTGANTIAPLLLSVKFLKSVLPEHCVQPFFDSVRRRMSGADGNNSLQQVGLISVNVAIRPKNHDAAPFFIKMDAALVDPLQSEVILSSEFLLQGGAAIYYPIPDARTAYIRLDRVSRLKYDWYNPNELQEMHYILNTGKTVTWFLPDPMKEEQITTIVYPIKHDLHGCEPVVTLTDTKIYPGEAREVQIQQWGGHTNNKVCRYFEPDEDLVIQGHLGPVTDGLARPMAGFLYGGACPAQNVLVVNQSGQEISIPGGTVIGTATAMDHPDAPQLMCDWGPRHRDEELVDEERHMQHVYQLGEDAAVR